MTAPATSSTKLTPHLALTLTLTVALTLCWSAAHARYGRRHHVKPDRLSASQDQAKPHIKLKTTTRPRTTTPRQTAPRRTAPGARAQTTAKPRKKGRLVRALYAISMLLTADRIRRTFPDLSKADFHRDLPFTFHNRYKKRWRSYSGNHDVVAEAVAKHPVKAARITNWWNLFRARNHVETQMREIDSDLEYHSYRVRKNQNKVDRAFFKSQGEVHHVRGNVATVDLDVRHNKTKGPREAKASGRQFRASENIRYHQWHVDNLTQERAWREKQFKALEKALDNK